jgi:hypothetical protein
VDQAPDRAPGAFSVTRHLPEASAPKSIRQAITTLREAESDLLDSLEAERMAQAGQQEAVSLDRQALADARSTGAEPPGHVHRSRAEEALAEATEVRQADELRVERAEQALARELDAQAEAWLSAIEKARDRADAEVLKRLSALREVETQRSELRAAAVWLGRLPTIGFDVATGRPPKPVRDETGLPDPHASGSMVSASTLFDVLSDYFVQTSFTGERERVAQYEAEQAEKERRVAELQELREAHPPVSSG